MANKNYKRPEVKCLDARYIREWVPEPERRRIELAQAYWIIRAQYCGVLVGRGICPIQCELCRETIVSIFDLKKATNPEALLTWRAKDKSAARTEELIAKQKIEEAYEFPSQETTYDPLASLFRKKPSENLFLDLAKDYL